MRKKNQKTIEERIEEIIKKKIQKKIKELEKDLEYITEERSKAWRQQKEWNESMFSCGPDLVEPYDFMYCRTLEKIAWLKELLEFFCD